MSSQRSCLSSPVSGEQASSMEKISDEEGAALRVVLAQLEQLFERPSRWRFAR